MGVASGRHVWRLKISAVAGGHHVIGVFSELCQKRSCGSCGGWGSFGNTEDGYAIDTDGGVPRSCCTKQIKTNCTTPPLLEGDVVAVILDMDKSSLSFSFNDSEP